MTKYRSLEDIENANQEPENETPKERTRRLARIKQARKRFLDKQREKSKSELTEPESSSKISSRTRSKRTESTTLRKQKSRESLTEEQRKEIKEKDRIARHIRYIAKQEELKEQFHKIGYCTIDNYNETILEDSRHRFDRMSNICNHCYALKWKEETKGFCCVNGQIILAPLSPAPPILYTLLTGNDPDSDEPYVKQIRLYNQILAFTSVSADVDHDLANAKEGVYTYKIHGALYHQIGGLMPNDENEPKFAQIYFHDSSLQYQLERRKELFPNLNEDMLNALLNELHAINPFITVFMTAGTRARNENLSDMILTIHNVHGKDMRRYNLPTASEISAIITDFTTEPRDIVIKTHEDKLHHISELHAAYDPLQYPLLFPYGEYGWHDNILRANEIASNPESRMSQSESIIPMEIDFTIPMDIEEREHTDIGSHTGASQAMSDLLIGSPSSIIMSKDKGKGKEKEIESDNDNNNNSESESELEAIFGDEDLEIQQKNKKTRRVTIREFIVYRIQIRDSNKTKNILHLSGRLFQQFMVDQYAKWESNNLRWYRNNQQQFRTEIYSGLQDIVSEDDSYYDKIGKKIILSSSFTGSTRYMQQLYQDSMAIVREYGKPDLFVTVTCNPNWPEIVDELLPNQQANDRPDLVARVFKLKLKSITHDLFFKGILGRVIAHVHVIEFQKRGLPHAHILLILSPEDKPKTPEEFDNIVCAEIPDEELQPLLFETISRNMIHGPCGHLNSSSPCMVDGNCSKHYPREFIEATTVNKYGYPLYRRRDNNMTIKKKKAIIDNRWIVPYNPYLCQKYDCHINVEICSSIRSVKYLYKYVYKGHDRIMVSIGRPNDEITKYLDARYVSAIESCWRLFNFGLQERSHKVERLPVHLPNQQSVIFRESDDISTILEKSSHTKLTRYFEICANNQDDLVIKNLRYIDIPKFFLWENGNWHRRKRSGDKVISRLYMCSPRDKERFYLRILLTQIHGATSYNDMRTINGNLYDTYEEAVRELGLLDDENDEFDKCIKEAATYKMPSKLRQLFASILLFCDPRELKAYDLLHDNIQYLNEDYYHQQEILFKQKKLHQQRNLDENNENLSDNDLSDEDLPDEYVAIAVNKALVDIEKYLVFYGKKLEDYGIVPPKYELLEEVQEINLISEEMNYDINELNTFLTREEKNLNVDQKNIYDTIIKTLNIFNGDTNQTTDQTVFFVDGPGGYGKTFLFNIILAKVRMDYGIAIAVASSGIAALLLTGGRTAHSRFKIPIKLTEDTILDISYQSELAELIRKTKLIIWDEAPMAHKFAFEAVDRTFRDITRIDKPFGGIIFILGGDFRQILPVVVRGTRSQITNACIKSSNLWQYVNTMQLTINMRIQDAEQKQFVDYLLQIGEGKEITYTEIGDDIVKLHDDMVFNEETIELLISNIFDNIDNNYFNNENYINYIKNRAILTLRNDDVDDINEKIINIFPGEAQEFLSADSVEDEDFVHQNLYPIEFLNTLTPSGTPPHKLVLKIGAPIILLRNINPTEGLCNGTRLIIRRFQQHVIDAEILTGSHLGKRVFIPRIRITPSNIDLPFQLVRRQFPIRLAFAMTINKAQGQTIPYMGLYLPYPVFAHGQLYVALSRVQSKNNIKILVKNGKVDDEIGTFTKNIVYKEIF